MRKKKEIAHLATSHVKMDAGEKADTIVKYSPKSIAVLSVIKDVALVLNHEIVVIFSVLEAVLGPNNLIVWHVVISTTMEFASKNVRP